MESRGHSGYRSRSDYLLYPLFQVQQCVGWRQHHSSVRGRSGCWVSRTGAQGTEEEGGIGYGKTELDKREPVLWHRGGSPQVTAASNNTPVKRIGSLNVKTASGLTKSVQLQQDFALGNFIIIQNLTVDNKSYNSSPNVKLVVTFTVADYEFPFRKQMSTETDVIEGQFQCSSLDGYWIQRIVIREDLGSSVTQYRFFGEIWNMSSGDQFEVGDSNWHSFGEVNNVPNTPMNYPSWILDLSSITFEIR